jgi:hypothetical protein
MTTTTPTAFDAILAAAQAAADAGDTMRARSYFRNATEIDPTSSEAWLGLAATAAVLHERRGLYERALSLNPTCEAAREGVARSEALLAAGAVLTPRPAAPAAPEGHAPAVATPELEPTPGPPAHGVPLRSTALALIGLVGLTTMGLLTAMGIFIFTSFLGFLLAFLAGSSVSELMVRLTAPLRRGLGGRPVQIAAALGMILGSLGAMALGGLLLGVLGVPLPAEAVAMARNSGVTAVEPAMVLLNNPGLLVFASSAVAATVFRLR